MALTRILFVSTAMSALMLCGTASAQQPGPQQYQDTPQSSTQQGGQERQQISPREVHAFFRQVENQINQAVQSGNARRLTQWTQNNIADGANFQAVIQIGGQNGPGGTPKEIRVLSLNKNDMLRRQRVALSIAPQFLNMMENYDLGIRVVNVQPIGNDAAIVRTRISESGTIGGNGRQLGRNPAIGTQGTGYSEPQNQMGSSEPQNQEQDRGLQPGQSGASRFQAQSEAQNRAQNDRQNQSQNEGQNQDQGAQGGRWGGGLQRQGDSVQGLSFDASAECTHVVQREPDSGHLTIGLSNCMGEMQF